MLMPPAVAAAAVTAPLPLLPPLFAVAAAASDKLLGLLMCKPLMMVFVSSAAKGLM
jgi:hypothetical protein